MHPTGKPQTATNLLTPRRSFIQTLALAGASVPIGLRHSLGAAAEEPGEWQLEEHDLRVRFSLASGKLDFRSRAAPVLSGAVARAVTAEGARSIGDADYHREIEVRRL